MKILYVTTISSTMNAFFKPHVEMLVKKGNTVDLACNDNGWPIDDFYKELNCNFYHIDFSRSPFSPDNIKAYGQLAKIIENGNYDIVHCHTPNASVITRLVCRKYRKKAGMRVFYTAHGFHFYKGAPKLNWLLFFPVEKFCSRFTDKLITINKEDFELAKNKFHAKEVCYVPGVGIDLSRFENVQADRNEKRREIGVPEDAKLILSVGELNDNKNHRVVLEAIAKLDDTDVHYVIAGVGDKKDFLLDLAKELGISERFHLLGYRNDVPELYKAADIFCFPSIREGLGLAAVEGMASGLPVIAAENRGTKEFIENKKNGFLCAYNDMEAFAEALKILLGDTEKRGLMSEKGKIISKKFGIDMVIEKMKEIYG